MTTRAEIKRLQQLRADLVQQRERHLKRLDNRYKGKPLAKGMAHLLSKQVFALYRQIRTCDREIQRQSESQGNEP